MINISEKSNSHKLPEMLKNLIADEKNWLANTANAAALIFQELEGINWAGFYFMEGQELVLGPFQGRPACVRIKIGKGVCGSAVKDKKTYVVDDVDQFEGHIACDSRTKSEIVIPLFKEDEIMGVMDIDSPITGRFTDKEQKYLQELAEILVSGSVFPEYF